nr:PREDICTED: alkylated DNA repair protein alkB homolog 8 isoform X2 [Struthio camelus australis]
MRKKILRKQVRAQHTLMRHEGIECVSHATQSLVVANGGLGNGMSRHQLLRIVEGYGLVETLLMPPNKPYSFVKYETTEEAKKAFDALNGKEVALEDFGQNIVLYINFVEKVFWKTAVPTNLPPGLTVVEKIISPEEERRMLEIIDWIKDEDTQNAQKTLKHRRVKHFGYEFCYDSNNVEKEKPLPGGLPEICNLFLENCLKQGYIRHKPDQLTVNQYEPGQGIPPHIDTHSAFEDEIISLSLGAQIVMDFKHPDGRTVAIMLPRRSLLVMTGESRYLWTHGITPRKYDVIQASELGQKVGTITADVGDLTLNRRETRTSFTFRKVRRSPCNCIYPSVCDSQKGQQRQGQPSFPLSEMEASKLEQEYVHKVYEEIAAHFSSTRHSPWPQIVEFLRSLPKGAIVADVGCGNGKYLGINKDLYMAKISYEKEQRQKLLKHLRGEDTWMLADVNERVEQLEKEHSVQKKKKKDKHSRKPKKEKKKSKKQKSEKKDDFLDSSSDSSVEWVESNVSQSDNTEKAWKVNEHSDTTKEPSLEREEWMTLDFMSLKTTSALSVKAEKQKEKLLEQQKAQEIEQARLAERELNPYWKDGGTGLPPEEGEAASVKKVTVVEDAGLSWLRKSYRRMKEQAEREKRNFEEIVAERYGSMEIFQSRLEEAEKVASKKENYYRQGRWRKSDYSESGQEKKEQHVKKETHDEDDRNKMMFRAYTGEKYGKGWVQENRGCKRDRSRELQDPDLSSPDSELRSYRSKAEKLSDEKQSLEKSSSLSNMKHKFLKPSEDDLSSYSLHNDCESQQSSLKLPIHSSLSSRFQKPGEDTALWTKTHAKDNDEKLMSDQKSAGAMDQVNKSWDRTASDGKEKSQQQYPENTPEKKETLSNNKTSCSRHVSKDEMSQVLSEEEMNKLGARIVKAELMGNMELASELQAELENARKLRENQNQVPAKPGREASSLQEAEQVVLVRTDHAGRAWPVTTPAEPLEPKGGRRKRQAVTTHMDKERVRYFQDDDHMSLKDLVKNEKMRTAEDQNTLFMRMASKLMEKTDREYYTLDDMFVSQAAKGERSGEEDERQRRKAIHEHQQLAAYMEKCPYCFDSSELSKHLIIAIGTKVYLSLPSNQSLTEGHCLIAPLQHHTAATLLDEDIWEEIQMFRKALVKMFEAKELDCVFLETNMSMKKRCHMVYECIPLPREVGDMAPIYFKKAIMESDEEWSMNKKLIDLSSKDVRKSVPKGLPYFSVDFGLQGGFAHVIEDQHKFPHYFGKEIIGGMLDLEPRLWRKGIRQNFEDQRKKVLQFAQWWKPYDFTKSKE